MPTKVIIVLLSLLLFKSRAATCISTGSGDWNTNSTWSCGASPNCGDSLIIQAGHTVTVNAVYNYESCTSKMIIVVKGILRFGNGAKLRLPCNSKLYVYAGGQIQSAGGGGNSNQIEVCGNSEWSAGQGNYTGPGCMPPTAPNCNGILPVELISFDAELCSEGLVCLFWETATEINNHYFAVERSEDGIHFEELTRVMSKSYGSVMHAKQVYNYSDNSPIKGIGYYRLKQVDYDGSVSFSEIIVANVLEEIRFSVSPNPAREKFVIKIKDIQKEEIIKISLLNSDGKQVYSDVVSVLNESEQEFQVAFGPGLYYCTFSCRGKEYHTKLVVE